jgi:hypothetical protein
VAEERARVAVEHLQQAVVEVIEAARAALDMLEDAVADPHLLTTIAGEAGKLVETIAQGVVQAATTVGGAGGSGGAADGSDDQTHGVERIRVS